ncbi:hypothetical protein PbJCM13498_21490 [Prolixibacter bellariivorans]|uniref:histidine kinase n=2 Tax=Prolixibacter bellariivorans TaxID=314319 RepID=A0A5M4B083_9BACT|nr:tetratricopeptide repeat protein [Prolixibacter bellariivorans]GET33286.1 hypothetical protein PbJCM13498_21490 [Prolixibacter bellariivorans]
MPRGKLVYITLLLGLVCIPLILSAKPNVEEVDSLVQKLSSVSEKNKAELLNQISFAYLYIDAKKAQNYAEQALELAIKRKDRKEEGTAYVAMGSNYFLRGEYEACLPLLKQGLLIGKDLNDRKLITNSLNSLGSYYNKIGDFKKALDAYEEALTYLKSPKDDIEIATIDSNLAGLYSTSGNYVKAMELFMRALTIFEKKGSKEEVARIKNNIAVAYHDWGNLDKALKYYNEALDVYRDLNQLSNEAIPLNNIGEIYKDRGEYEKAIDYYRQCYGIGIMLDNRQYESIGILGMGEALIKLNRIDEGEAKILEAKAKFESMNYVEGLAHVYYNMGLIADARKQSDQAMADFEKSIDYAKKLHIIDLLEKNYAALSRLVAITGDYRRAFELYNTYSTIRDSAFNESKAKLITEIQSRYELEQKQNEIEILTRDNAIKDLELGRKRIRFNIMLGIILVLAVFSALVATLYTTKRKSNLLLESSNEQILQQKDELEKLNTTKDKLLSIIGHDLRGSIGASKSMLHQLIKEPDVFPPEEQEQIKEELYRLSENTYELLENLLSWAKSQRGLKIFKDANSIRRLVDSNIEQQRFFTDKKNIELTSQLTEDCMVYCDRNMINMVIRNLLTNATKFTPEKGKITVFGHRAGNNYRVSIKDNGVGIPAENISRIFDSREFFTTYGTNSEKGSGLGLILCKEFVEKNGGEISVESDLGRGTTFSFTLVVATGVNSSSMEMNQENGKGTPGNSSIG